MNLLSQNAKIKKNSIKTFNFGIPAYKSISGLITCPMAKECVKPCYARQGAYLFGNVKSVYEQRLDATLKDSFPLEMVIAIIESGAGRIRIHDSGDFYSREYLSKWLKVMDALPHVEFYCYTKMIGLFESMAGVIPDNFKVCYSYGGHEDYLINPKKHRHAKVFTSTKRLLNAGYANASNNDEICLGDNPKIGLVYHGFSSREVELGVDDAE